MRGREHSYQAKKKKKKFLFSQSLNRLFDAWKHKILKPTNITSNLDYYIFFEKVL